MAEKSLSSIPLLKGDNYFNWRVKMESVLQLKRLQSVLTEDRPKEEEGVERTDWDEKNADAVAYIRLSLSDEQVLQFASYTNAKQLWQAILDAYTGPAEDRAIDAGEELRNIKMSSDDTVSEYISRARGLAVKCNEAGLCISERQLVYNVVRGLHQKFSQIQEILKTQREKKIDEVQEILKEKERELQRGNAGTSNIDGHERAYIARGRQRNNKKKCFVCGKLGHIAKDCYYRKDKQGQPTYENRRKYANETGNYNKRANYALTKREDAVNFQVFNANICPELSRNKWIIDSGCTAHMTNERRNFVTFKTVNGKVYLAGRYNVLKSKGIGTIEVKVQNDKNQLKNVTLHDVVYVPSLRNNLLSVKKLIDRGLNVSFTDHGVTINKKDSNEIIVTGKRMRDHFIVDLIPESRIDNNYKGYNVEINNDMSGEISQAKFNGNMNNIWHRRLGHINNKYVKRLIEDELAIGIKRNIESVECDACKTCKLLRKPHKTVTHDQSTEPLELLHMDVCGPMPVESIGKARYILLIIDDYSGMYFTYFLRNKSEVFISFRNFKERYENILRKNIKRIRTDNGTEFINNEFQEYTNREGIEHQKTVPHNPESNGKVERGNRVILERARTLLYEADLPLHFWAEAVAYVTQTVNLTPRKNKDKTPYELWCGKKPNLSYLRTFGCLAYYHLPKNARNKLQPSGRKAIMLGYSRERIGYRLYDVERRQTIEERNVIFDETKKGRYYLTNCSIVNKYTDWEIEDIFDIPNDNSKSNIKDIEIKLEAREENITDDENNTVESDVECQNELQSKIDKAKYPDARSKGKPKGSTMAKVLKRKQEQLKEREERLIKEGVRRSQRMQGKHQAQMVENITIPNDHNEASKDKNWKHWQNAMQNEIQSLNDHEVWDVIDRPNNAKVIKSKWVFSIKKGNKNDDVRFKARLVAAGYGQVKNRDYKESYSPVISIEAWRTLMALAAKKHLNVRFFDVKTAYLHGELNETVYMEPPPTFEDKFGIGKICKLKRSLYGLPQSGRNWYYRLKAELLKNGFTPLASENCIFYNSRETCFFIFSSYVDDFTTLDNNHHTCEKLIDSLRESFDINETTASKTFLGINIECDKLGVHLNQSEYIKTLLEKYGMLECKPVSTPIVPGEDRKLDETVEEEDVDMEKYQELVGELLYLANRTRPDIAYVTSYLSQYNHCPKKRHHNIAKRVLRYLSGTMNKRLTYDREHGMLKAYSDASWGTAEKAKSFSGGAIFIGKSLISWRCNKQRVVGNSTCEVELCALAEIVKDTMWIQNMLKELKCEDYLNIPIEIFCDNQATIQWLNNASSSKKTRHVNLKYHFVRDEIEKGLFKILYICTKEMIADSLTKPVPKEKLEWSCKQMSITG